MFYDFIYLAKGFRMRPKVRSTLRLIEPLNYFETHYWRFRQTYFFKNNYLLEVYRANKLKESHGC